MVYDPVRDADVPTPSPSPSAAPTQPDYLTRRPSFSSPYADEQRPSRNGYGGEASSPGGHTHRQYSFDGASERDSIRHSQDHPLPGMTAHPDSRYSVSYGSSHMDRSQSREYADGYSHTPTSHSDGYPHLPHSHSDGYGGGRPGSRPGSSSGRSNSGALAMLLNEGDGRAKHRDGSPHSRYTDSSEYPRHSERGYPPSAPGSFSFPQPSNSESYQFRTPYPPRTSSFGAHSHSPVGQSSPLPSVSHSGSILQRPTSSSSATGFHHDNMSSPTVQRPPESHESLRRQPHMSPKSSSAPGQQGTGFSPRHSASATEPMFAFPGSHASSSDIHGGRPSSSPSQSGARHPRPHELPPPSSSGPGDETDHMASTSAGSTRLDSHYPNSHEDFAGRSSEAAPHRRSSVSVGSNPPSVLANPTKESANASGSSMTLDGWTANHPDTQSRRESLPNQRHKNRRRSGVEGRRPSDLIPPDESFQASAKASTTTDTGKPAGASTRTPKAAKTSSRRMSSNKLPSPSFADPVTDPVEQADLKTESSITPSKSGPSISKSSEDAHESRMEEELDGDHPSSNKEERNEVDLVQKEMVTEEPKSRIVEEHQVEDDKAVQPTGPIQSIAVKRKKSQSDLNKLPAIFDDPTAEAASEADSHPAATTANASDARARENAADSDFPDDDFKSAPEKSNGHSESNRKETDTLPNSINITKEDAPGKRKREDESVDGSDTRSPEPKKPAAVSRRQSKRRTPSPPPVFSPSPPPTKPSVSGVPYMPRKRITSEGPLFRPLYRDEMEFFMNPRHSKNPLRALGTMPQRDKTQRQTPPRATEANDVARHYNARPNQDLYSRDESPIIGLRNFNNWIKSVLIQKFTRRRPDFDRRLPNGRVLDMGCGKGGDLRKWELAEVDEYFGLDVASRSIEDFRERIASRRRPSRTRFYLDVLDCFGDDITHVLRRDQLEPLFDCVSMQFCIHYAFNEVSRVRRMLENVSRFLRPGGVFFGTTLSAEKVLAYLSMIPPEAGRLLIENDYFKIEFYERHHDGPYGHAYKFTLRDAVDDCEEYVVHWESFEGLCLEYGLRCIYRRDFDTLFDEELASRDNARLAENMKVTRGGDLLMDEGQWVAATMYMAFAFEKMEP